MGEGNSDKNGDPKPPSDPEGAAPENAASGPVVAPLAGAENAAPRAVAGPVSFEQAEFEESATAPPGVGNLHCSRCNAAPTDEYYVANERPLCQRCHAELVQQIANGAGGNLPAALAWGLGGALLGAGLYYAVSAISGYEIGLVAIVVGILVGKGVRRGAGLRTHWVYRALGLSLTYLAIVSTYMPDILQGLTAPGSSADTVEVAAAQGDVASASAPDEADAASAVSAPEVNAALSPVVTPVLWLLAFVLCLVAPVFMLMEGQIMGLIILAIGLWEGYKFSAAPKIGTAGPFKINAAGSEPSPTT